MTKLTFEPITLKSAGFGELNPMPDLKNVSYIHAKFETSDAVTGEDRRHFGEGSIHTLLPYLSQDGYDRELRDTVYQAAILENECMRAVFLPELGGRLWSLYHKGLNKELLYVNEIVQPCNLGLRNAWVAGGVEWNCGIKGHSPFTCDRIFAAESRNQNGQPILSMYEFERIRQTVFGINAMLEGDRLYIRTTVENPNSQPAYTYWWSNIAVPERGTRVLTEADEMFTCVYGDNRYMIGKVPAPIFDSQDISFPENAVHAGDVFYITKPTPKRWIAAIGTDGCGLLQYSSPELQGRKVFFWGQGAGGRNWNRWLTGSDRGYIEIQAGLLKTQMEHIPMPPHSCWSWTECYTAASGCTEALSCSWHAAGQLLGTLVSTLSDPAAADIPLDAAKTVRVFGSGWGALEDRPVSAFYPFPKESLTALQTPWLHLRTAGYLPEPSPELPPESYLATKETLALLEDSLKHPQADHWFTWLHIGIARYCLGELQGACRAWQTSCERTPNPWAFRNLAMIKKNEFSDPSGAVADILTALSLSASPCCGLLQDAAAITTHCGAPEIWLSVFSGLPESLQKHGRLRLYTVVSYLRLGDKASAREILNDTFIMNDIKEGELSVSTLWKELYGSEKPLPDRLNFRMYDK